MPTFDLNSHVGQLINFECYVGQASNNTIEKSVRFLGTATVDLPEIAYQVQEISGAGIAGKMRMPSLAMTESLGLTLHWRSMTPEVSYLARQEPHDVALYGAVNKYSHSANREQAVQGVLPVRIEFRGVPIRTTVGKFAPNELMESASEFELIMLKIMVGGTTRIAINKLDYIFKIDGEDYTSELKTALGRK